MDNYRLSEFVRRFDKGNYSALFNGLTLQKIYSEKNYLDSMIQSAQNSESPLRRHGFCTTPEQDNQRYQILKSGTGHIGIKNIVMLVDNRCNYRCDYCQIEENMNESQMSHSMTLDTAEKALDLFEANIKPDDKKTVSITGGEPLMNIPAVKYILERVMKIKGSRVIIFTNGSLVTKELADFFARTKALMLVSLDGPAEVHNKFRVFKNGTGTFESSLEGYKLLRDAGCKTGISAVTGVHNIEKIDEVIDYFVNLGISSLGLNFGHHLLEKDNHTAITMEQYADFLIKVYLSFRERGIFVENISRFIEPFTQQVPRYNECQAQGRGFCIDSRGKIGVCKSLLVSDKISKAADEVNRDISKETEFIKWARRSPFTMEECNKCSAIGVCGGGCTYDAFAANAGNIEKIDKRLCDFSKKILEFLIWDLFEEIKHKMNSQEFVIPDISEQINRFQRFYDPENQLQRSVGHEKDA
ncbi:MAG: radical SAM protein [Candidatus Riflebacteria bacterium]|nr:radical SAM protein [Candidatus Riflebacteria bacterium]